MYIVIELQTNSDGTVGNFVWAFADEEHAFSKYHAVLASASVSALPVHSCVILRHDGVQIAGQAFKHDTPEPESVSP